MPNMTRLMRVSSIMQCIVVLRRKRHSFDVEDLSPRDLWETYLPAFKALVQEADVKEVMCAYQRLEGEPCCGSNRVVNANIEDEWGYKHFGCK